MGEKESPGGSYWRRLRKQKDDILNVRAGAVERRSLPQRMLARTARFLAHPIFFLGELAFHLAWVLLNTRPVAGVAPWDPYLFSLLTGLASVQALFIGLLILMYAEQNSGVAEVREEMDLQVALHSERESSKLISMLAEVHEALGIRHTADDKEVQVMSEPLDPKHLQEVTAEQLRDAGEL